VSVRAWLIVTRTRFVKVSSSFSSTFQVSVDKLLFFIDIPGYSPPVKFRSFVFSNIPGYTFIFAIAFPLYDSLELDLATHLVSST
jgi:hypothetical protein